MYLRDVPVNDKAASASFVDRSGNEISINHLSVLDLKVKVKERRISAKLLYSIQDARHWLMIIFARNLCSYSSCYPF